MIVETEENTNELGIANSSARLLPAGTVCLSRTASVGYVVVTERPMATSQDFVNWVCGTDLDPLFLKYIFIAEGANLLRFSSGAVHQTIYFPEVKAFHACVPSRSEQQRIVAILDEAFEGIATAKANAEKNLKSSRELLTDHSDRLFTGGVSDWSELPLEAVASITNGFAFKSADFTSSVGVKCIKITNVGVGEFVQTVGDLLPLDFSDKYAAFEARKGNIVLALTRAIIATGLKVAVVPDGYDKALVNQRVAAIAPSPDRVSAEFLSTYLSTRRVREYVEDRVITLMQPNLSILDLRSLPVPVPNMSIQQRLLQSLAILRQEVETAVSIYRRKIAALDELKKSLLHQAFSGVL